MNVLKNIGIILLCVLCVGLMALALAPFFVTIDLFLGMEPMIICIVLAIIGFVFSYIIKNPYLEKLFGFFILACAVGVIAYYALMSITGAAVPIWIVLLITFALALGVFLTSVLKNVPFFGNKIIPVMWFLIIIITYMIIVFNTMPVEG